jgi:hypothetical protein
VAVANGKMPAATLRCADAADFMRHSAFGACHLIDEEEQESAPPQQRNPSRPRAQGTAAHRRRGDHNLLPRVQHPVPDTRLLRHDALHAVVNAAWSDPGLPIDAVARRQERIAITTREGEPSVIDHWQGSRPYTIDLRR